MFESTDFSFEECEHYLNEMKKNENNVNDTDFRRNFKHFQDHFYTRINYIDKDVKNQFRNKTSPFRQSYDIEIKKFKIEKDIEEFLKIRGADTHITVPSQFAEKSNSMGRSVSGCTTNFNMNDPGIPESDDYQETKKRWLPEYNSVEILPLCSTVFNKLKQFVNQCKNEAQKTIT